MLCYCCHDKSNIIIVEILLSSFFFSFRKLCCPFVDDLLYHSVILLLWFTICFYMFSWFFLLFIVTVYVGISILFMMCIVWMRFALFSQLIPCHKYGVLYAFIYSVDDLNITWFVTICI